MKPAYSGTRLAFLFFAKLILFTIPAADGAAFHPQVAALGERPDAQEAFNRGRYREAIKLAKQRQSELGRFGINESLPVLIARAQLQLGEYRAAKQTLEQALVKYDRGIQVRWLAKDVYRFNGDAKTALTMLKEIQDLASRSAWMYRDTPNQLILGQYFLSQGADPKKVLNSFYRPALKRNPADPEVFRAIGKLSLDKADYGLAAENYEQVIKILPEDSDAHFRLAQCYLPSDAKRATKFLNQALTLNPKHIEALLIIADRQLGAEQYDDAIESLNQVFAINDKHPVALAYRAAIAHLQNDLTAESKYRELALSTWEANPEIDHVIGRELSEKYRFSEGESYQRRSLIYDTNYLPAKIQLAHDLLRLGQEVEGWKLADEVFDDDQYSVLAHNLVALRDQMASFVTLSADNFVVRMSPQEARIYGRDVLELLSQASESLAQKYQMELEGPIVVEIFPRQEDFAIRTFGLPGGSGFLGVCFGRVITMNSPAAQGASLTNWKSVLWHEFCHVVTLQKTNNKMPRWLSEGISVYEEKLADSAWGESMSQRYRDMLLNELTPVSQLSGAFLRPPSPAHLQFAYFESSLVVEYLISQHGLEKLLQVLDALAIGTPINQALAELIEPIDQLDENFVKFATAKANEFAPEADWTQPKNVPPGAPLEFWQIWNRGHPGNLPGLIGEAGALLKSQRPTEAIKRLDEARQLCPQEGAVFALLASAYRQLGQPDNERNALEQHALLEASDPEIYLRLLELTTASEDWAATQKYARQLAAVDPLRTTSHQKLAQAAEKLGDALTAANALEVLAEMDPLDPADVRYRLARAQFELKNYDQAKRQVLMALEQAPRYRDAQKLLLKIVDSAKEQP